MHYLDLATAWDKQAQDYMRTYKSMRCNCSTADRQVYLRVSLSLTDCARQLREAHEAAEEAWAAPEITHGSTPAMEEGLGSTEAASPTEGQASLPTVSTQEVHGGYGSRSHRE